jgi:hypothetical protein
MNSVFRPCALLAAVIATAAEAQPPIVSEDWAEGEELVDEETSSRCQGWAVWSTRRTPLDPDVRVVRFARTLLLLDATRVWGQPFEPERTVNDTSCSHRGRPLGPQSYS